MTSESQTVRRSEVGALLLTYGLELESQGAAQVGGSFTGNPKADLMLRENPNAFLIGVLFTQGIPAERAWSGPYLLAARLGHLDIERIAHDEDAVVRAVQLSPMLHRFKNNVPKWIVRAASRLCEFYGGDASNIWPEGSSVIEVTERLSEFDGIGRKKAVMATEILRRHFNVELAGESEGQVAYDVQVRRVFLRSGLVERDTISQVEAAAKRISPDAPATLDLAAWLIGRETCRPKSPLCDECRLGGPCPRLIHLNVEGVGARR